MKLLYALFSLIPVVLSLPTDSYTTQYAGTKVLRVPTGDSVDALTTLKSLIKRLDLESWTTVPKINSHVDLEVPRGKYEEFMSEVDVILRDAGITDLGFGVEVMHDDLGKSILDESASMNTFAETNALVGLATPAWFNAYHSYADHLTFLKDLVALYPNNSRIVSSGTSVEGRSISGINIYGTAGPEAKPAIVWHGTVHAREWISTMTTEYMAYELLNNYGNSTQVKGIVDKYDFYIFPVVNPDGFVYSQVTTRTWRKNRQTPPSGSTCYGRDINRNWNVAWSDTGGASTSACAEDFKGKAPLDAPETAGLAKFLNDKAASPAGAKMFVDWHSYSQMFFTPYGYDCNAVAPDHTELMSLAGGFVNNLEAVYGTQYEYGPSCQVIYKTTGSSDDYAYIVSKIKYSFSAELRDTGNYGFVLPANQIRPTGLETWTGIKYILTNMK